MGKIMEKTSSVVNKAKANDIFVRAFKTLWQGALSYLMLALPALQINFLEIFTDWSVASEFLQTTGLSILCGALAAGISAVWNGFVRPYAQSLKAKNQGLGLTPEELGVTEEAMSMVVMEDYSSEENYYEE